MHLRTFITAPCLFAACVLANLNLSPTITFGTVEAPQASRISSDWETYATHLVAQPAYTSWEAGLEDLKNSLLEKLASDDSSWYTRLPSDQQKYMKSVEAEYSSIENRDRNLPTANSKNGAPAETGAVMMVGAAVAGVLGVAAML